MNKAVSLSIATASLALSILVSAASASAAPSKFVGIDTFVPQIHSVDDGTGYWGAQTATGGPSGGLPNTQ